MNDLSTDTSPSATFSLTPRNFEEAMRFCTTLAKSNLVPKDFVDQPANIMVAVQWGMELGLQPMQAMQSIAVINGRPSLWGDAVIALVRASGLCEYVYEEIGADGQSATCRTKRKGDEKEQVRTFTVADAEKAGLKGKQGPWTQYPKRMLQMRARSWCLRDVYPDVLRGVHVAEEAQDIPEKDITLGTEVIEQPHAKSEREPKPVAQAQEPKTPEASKPEPKQEAAAEPKPTSDAAGASAMTGKPLADGQLRIIRAKLKQSALTENDLVAHFGKVEDLRFEQFEQIQGWITERSAKVAG